jgi:hypothetical protein
VSLTQYLIMVRAYIEQCELQFEGTDLRPEMHESDVPLIYAETVRMLAIVERKP